MISWGNSWGSILGVHMAKAHSELFYAYPDTSQVVSYHENQATSYTRLLALARATDDKASEDCSFLNFVGMKGDGMFSQVDLPRPGTDFAIPMFFVEGAHDLLATPDVAQRYYNSLKAPQKDLMVLKHVGHDPNQDVVDTEDKMLKERILPLVK